MPWATTESPLAQRTLPDTAARSQTSKSYKLPSLWYSVSATEKGIRHFWHSLSNFSCYKDMHMTKDLPIQIYYSRLWPETSNLSVSKNHCRVLLKPVFSASPPKIWCHKSGWDIHIHKPDTFLQDVWNPPRKTTSDRATILVIHVCTWDDTVAVVTCICRGCWVCSVGGFGVWWLARLLRISVLWAPDNLYYPTSSK